MKSGKRYWADGTLVAGQQFEYGFDDIGNRSGAKTGGDALGANLRSQGYTVNDLNLYTARTNPRYLEVQGAAQTTATVQVDGSTSGVLRQGEYFRKELGSIAGTGPVWQTVTVALSGGTNTGTKRLFLPPATESYTHDADGNLTQDGQWDYGWDAENRLVAMSSVLTGSPAAPLNATLARKLTWQYDGLGRVLERTETAWSVVDAWWAATPMAITRYLYDGWDCVAEFSVSGGTVTHQRSYVWGLDLSGSRTGAGGVGGLVTIYQAPMSSPTAHFTAYDGNGNVIGLVKASDGTLSARYEYGPFGEALRATGDAIAAANPWRFSTKRSDPVTALVHYEYRVYSPVTGRWLSRDPIGERGGFSINGLLGNHSTGAVDSLGMYEVDVHRYLTQYLAGHAGFCASSAEKIGNETQALDDPGSTRDAMLGGRHLGNMRAYHFVSQGQLAHLRQKAMEACACNCATPDWRAIGEYLHALEDTYSHSTGEGDRNWDYYNGPAAVNGTIPEVTIPQIPLILPDGATIGGQSFEAGFNVGHGGYGHFPDWTWRDKVKSMKMAETVFGELSALAKNCGGGCPAASWENLRNDVQQFVDFVPDTYFQWTKIKKVSVPVPNATFEGYNQKIQILNPNYNLHEMYKQNFRCKQ